MTSCFICIPYLRLSCYQYRVPPDPHVLWMLGQFDCEDSISDVRGNKTFKVQPVKGHYKVLNYVYQLVKLQAV